MAWLCTSDNCKLLLLIFVVFLAGYFLAENDVAKRPRQANLEHFQASKETEKEYYAIEETPNPVEIPTAEVEIILAKIDRVYKEVYGEPVPADKMSLYYKSLGSADFDEGSFKRRLSVERKTAFETMVKDVFMEVLKRLPTPTELQKYIDLYVGNQMKTQQDLEFILRLDIESVVRSNKSEIPEPEKKEDYGTYKVIISAFEEVLGRNPNTSELKFYYDLIKNNNYDQNKLKDILLSSREHEILMKNQNNQVHGELAGNITEKQLEIAINELYMAVFFEYPDEDTYKYLRGRFVAMNLDEEKFAFFLRRLKSAESSNDPTMTPTTPTTTTVPPTTTTSVPSTTMTSAPPTTKSVKELFEEIVTATPDISPRMMSLNVETVPPLPNVDGITEKIGDQLASKQDNMPAVYEPPMQPDTRPLPPLPTEPTKKDKTTGIDASLDAIKCAKYFDKSRFESAQDMRGKTFGYVPPECRMYAKNKTNHYLNADDNLVLLPEMQWEVPMRRPPVCYATQQIEYRPSVEQTSLLGTLLDDAEKTSVGSIMSKFEYKELQS
jgi:hypothetical protein